MEPKVPEPDKFVVYRKHWYGETTFCICDEVQQLEDVFIMKVNDRVIAILPKSSFSCAISINLGNQK